MSRLALRSITAVSVLVAAGLPATLVTPLAQATSAPTTAYAVIGSISTPAKIDQLAVDVGDDTVYAGSFLGSILTVLRPGMTSGSVSTTLALPGQPASIAVDSDDDTVYVRPNTGAYFWVTRGARSLADTVGINQSFGLTSLAVYSPDDTIYASMPKYGTDDSFVAINGMNTDDSIEGAPVGVGTSSLAVDQQLGTIWAAGFNSSTLRTATGMSLQFVDVPGTYTDPRDLVVASTTHQAFVSNTVNASPAVQKVDATGTLATWSDPAATSRIRKLSVNPTGSRVVFASGNSDDSLWFVNAATMQTEAAPLTIPSVRSTAQASSGLVYVGHNMANSILVVAKVQGSLSAASAQVGDTLTVSVTPTPATAAGQSVTVDDSTIPSISFGGYSAPATRTATNTFTVTVPQGPSGTVEAVATLAGGATMSLGSVAIGGTPAPAPAPIPASPPTSVNAEAGDRSAVVSWAAPASTGSFAVTTYQVTSSPGGRSCLTEAASCTVSGLTNGTAYSFTVRALTGAGWSAESEPSKAVVPRADAGPLITITGSRDGTWIEIAGRTTGFGMAGTLRPWVRLAGQASFVQGAATILVSADGTFEWGRRSGKRVSVYVATPDGSLRSNTVMIPARR